MHSKQKCHCPNAFTWCKMYFFFNCNRYDRKCSLFFDFNILSHKCISEWKLLLNWFRLICAVHVLKIFLVNIELRKSVQNQWMFFFKFSPVRSFEQFEELLQIRNVAVKIFKLLGFFCLKMFLKQFPPIRSCKSIGGTFFIPRGKEKK